MKRKIFKTDALENEFREKGYVVIPFLEKEQLKILQEAFYNTKPSNQKGFHSTSTNNNLEYRKSVNDLIQSIYYPLSQQYIEDYDPIYASFVVKEPGQEGNFPLHMDWSMVDERNYISLAFWSPLVNTNSKNGPLIVLEESQKIGLSFRGGPFLFQALNDGEIPKFKYKTQTLFLKAGEVVIYDHRLFHGSLPNLTLETRPALNFTMKPKEAKLLHYHQNESEIETHFVDENFFNYYVMGNQPEGYPLTKFACNDMLFLNDQLITILVK